MKRASHGSDRSLLAAMTRQAESGSASQARGGRVDCVRLATAMFVSFDGGVSARAEYHRPDRYRLVETDLGGRPRIARGGGYSYAAASFAAGSVVQDMTRFDRVLRFEPASRLIEVETGVTLGDLLDVTMREGLWLPVQPGYPAITVGGCVAANVHGKNPALAGTFIRWVEGLTVFHPKRGVIRATRSVNPELFELTCGGYGLTGVILACTLRLEPLIGTRLAMRRIPVATLAESLAALRATGGHSAFTYAWHDAAPNRRTFGRGIVYDGAFIPGSPALSGAARPFRALTPTTRARLPVSLWRPLTTRAFNAVYWHLEAAHRQEAEIALFHSLYPFAHRAEYFTLFGRPGLIEYQVLVSPAAIDGFLAALERCLLAAKPPAVLISLKQFGGTRRYLRFEGEGFCVTVNLARTAAALAFLPQLDDLTIAFRGLPNLIKDSRLPASVVRACYPEYETFRDQLLAHDRERLFRSELSERLAL